MTDNRGETFLRKLLKWYHWFWHKYGDVRYCIHCGKPLPKSENAPDFAAAVVYTWVEAKNSDSTGTWRWTEISSGGDRANQRAWLLKNRGWLFVELGQGTAPKGKSAYLIPFIHWVEQVEPILDAKGMKSIRRETLHYRNPEKDRPGADELLKPYSLIWMKGQWIVPDNHIWWRSLRSVLQKQLQEVEGHIDEQCEGDQGILFEHHCSGYEDRD